MPPIFALDRCISLNSEFLKYKADVKERDYAVATLRYALKLQVAASLFPILGFVKVVNECEGLMVVAYSLFK